MINEMNINTSSLHDMNDYKRDQFRIKCFTSELTINSVEEADLGDYECGVGYVQSWGERKYYVDDARNITVFQFDPAYKLPKKVAYFEIGLNQGKTSKVLMQCVVEGGPAQWLIKFHNNAEYKTMEKLDNDIWRCFNYREISRNVSDISESFIFFEDVCRFDMAEICCGAESEELILSNCASRGKPIQISPMGRHDINDYSTWSAESKIDFNLRLVIPMLTVLFFILALILACRRPDLCCECSLPSTQYSRVPNMQYVADGQVVQPLPCQNAPPNLSTDTPAGADDPPEYAE